MVGTRHIYKHLILLVIRAFKSINTYLMVISYPPWRIFEGSPFGGGRLVQKGYDLIKFSSRWISAWLYPRFNLTHLILSLSNFHSSGISTLLARPWKSSLAATRFNSYFSERSYSLRLLAPLIIDSTTKSIIMPRSLLCLELYRFYGTDK